MGMVVAVVDEVDPMVLVVEEIGTLSTVPDPPPQETIKKVLTHAKEKEDLKLINNVVNDFILDVN